MPFGEVFAEVRSKRGIKMREFDGSPAYIHDIEKKGMLPSAEKLETLLAHIGKVATEQDAANIDDEMQELRQAWFESHFIRLGIDAELAPSLAILVGLDPKPQATIVQAIEAVPSLGQ
jgi:hypothetical protein